MISELNKGKDADLGKVSEISATMKELSSNSSGLKVETADLQEKVTEVQKMKEENIEEKNEVEVEEDKERTPWGDAEARRNNPYM